MRHALLSGGSRKRMSVDHASSNSEMSSQRQKPALVGHLVHNTTGRLHLEEGPQNVLYSSASFNANELSTDQRVLQVGEDHILTVVLKSKPTARGGNYLRQHLYQELLAQRRKHPGDLAAALKNSIAELNKGFQSLHPFNLDVLQGLKIAIAFADFSAKRLHVASNGGCRCILGRNIGGGDVQIVADVGRNEQMEDNDVAVISNVADIHLDSSIDVMVLGSAGFWREVAPYKAVLRASYFFTTAPGANNQSAAANLINYSLHCVTQRMKAHPDRRMVSLNSVSNLVSLQAGHKGQFKYGHKQPVRRRRGDVHDDLTAMIAFFDWKGAFSEKPAAPISKAKESKWATVRLAFRFHIASSNRNIATWQSVVSSVLSQLRDTKAKNGSVSGLKKSLQTGSEASRSSGESSSSSMSTY